MILAIILIIGVIVVCFEIHVVGNKIVSAVRELKEQ